MLVAGPPALREDGRDPPEISAKELEYPEPLRG